MQEQIFLQARLNRATCQGGEVSSSLKDMLRKLGIKSDISRRVTIVTYELEMNIIIHSLGGRSRFDLFQHIKVIASDRGPGIPDMKRRFSRAFRPQMTLCGGWVLAQGWALTILGIIQINLRWRQARERRANLLLSYVCSFCDR